MPNGRGEGSNYQVLTQKNLDKGATTDIAIWSTVEQGLAITAGSLATLRPLLRKFTVRMGWSKPSGTRPSGAYGSRGLSGATGRKNSKVLGAFSLSAITKSDEEKASANSSSHRGGGQPLSPEWTEQKHQYQHQHQSQQQQQQQQQQFSKVTSSSASRGVYGMTTESQEELRGTQRSKGSLEDIHHGVIITKSWLVTSNEPR